MSESKQIVDSAALWISLRLTHIAWTTLLVAHTLHNPATIIISTMKTMDFRSSLLIFKFIKNGSLLILK